MDRSIVRFYETEPVAYYRVELTTEDVRRLVDLLAYTEDDPDPLYDLLAEAIA